MLRRLDPLSLHPLPELHELEPANSFDLGRPFAERPPGALHASLTAAPVVVGMGEPGEVVMRELAQRLDELEAQIGGGVASRAGGGRVQLDGIVRMRIVRSRSGMLRKDASRVLAADRGRMQRRQEGE